MTLTRIDHYLSRLMLSCYCLLFLATPLIWSPANSELFELPKMMFVYLMSLLVGSLWLGRMIVRQQVIAYRTSLHYLVLFFLVTQLISTIFSIHPHTSIHGFYTRFHGGLLSTIAYSVLYFALVSNFGKKEVLRLISVLIASGFIVSLVAFPEHFGYALSCLVIGDRLAQTGFMAALEANCWQQDIVTRVFGTFGQPNWLAAFIISLLPLVWAKGLITYLGNKLKPQWLIFLAINTVMISSLIFTKSRSGLLGFGLGLALFVIGSSLITRFRATQFLAILLTTNLLIFAVYGSIYTPSLYQLLSRDNKPAQTVIMPGAISSTTVLDRGGTESGEIRQIVWRGAVDIFRNNFLVGSGVETFAYAYYNYRPLAHNLVSEWDFLYNKAHNEFLNMAATTGLLGLSAYLGLILWSFVSPLKIWWHSFRTKIRKSATDTKPLYALAIASGLASMHVSNFFGFSTVAIGLLFFLMPAALVLILNPDSRDVLANIKIKLPHKLNTSQYISLAFLILVSGAVGIGLGRYYYADVIYAQAKTAEANSELMLGVELYQHAINLRPDQDRYYNDFANLLAKTAYSLALEEKFDTASQFGNYAQIIGIQALELNPVHLNNYKSQAGVFIRLSALEPDLLETAATILEQALLLAPTDAKLTYNLGLIKLDQLATDSAQLFFEKSVDLKPNYEAARMDLAQIYEQQGELDLALEQYQYILNYIAPENSIARERVAEINNLPTQVN